MKTFDLPNCPDCVEGFGAVITLANCNNVAVEGVFECCECGVIFGQRILINVDEQASLCDLSEPKEPDFLTAFRA